VTTIVRCAALWLSGAALGVSAAFFSYQVAFFPDVYLLGYLILNALLLVVALFAGATIVRCAALWLSGAALGVSAAFFSYQAAFFPDVYFLGYLILNALLLVVALFAGAISLRPSSCSKAWTAPLLGVGHVTAAVGTHELLRSRITCFNIQQAVDYWLPTDSGPLLLFGPSLAALAASALWKRLRRPRPPASLVL
jgi:hypothetical protein